MVHFPAISIFLLPVATILSSEFWNDVDEKYNELSDPEDSPTQATLNNLPDSQELPTQATTSQAQPEGPHSNNQVPSVPRSAKNPRKHVSFLTDKMIPFNDAVTIDSTYPKNLSETDIVNKLVKLGSYHEWPDLRTYNLHVHSVYWAKICTFFSELNLTGIPRVVCKLSPTFGIVRKRKSIYMGRMQFYDLLGCHCHGYYVNCNIAATPTVTFLIHQSSANEFFVFKQTETFGQHRLYIKNFKGGITLPNPGTFNWLNQ